MAENNEEMSNEMRINVGDYKIISSGSVIIPNSEFVEFLYDDLKFKIVFKTETDGKGNLTRGRYETSLEDDPTTQSQFLKITMFNQNKSVFSSTSKMIPLAEIDGRKLMLKFCIHSINPKDDGNEDKIFFYTWFLEK
jgi:hypothetical protein